MISKQVPRPHQQESIDDDSLEYYIKFPSPSQNNLATAAIAAPTAAAPREMLEPEDYVFVANNSEPCCVPIVMLLGWAGCQDKYLMKYSKIYEDRGLITIRYTAPVQNLFWRREEMKLLGEKVLKLIFDMKFDSHPIFFHIFSNGGAFTYQHIVLALAKSHRHLQVLGIIFDSAPGERRFMSLYRAITAIYGRERTGHLASFFISVTLVLIWLVEDSYRWIRNNLFSSRNPLQSGPMQDLLDEPSTCPQMFLYSKEDIIIPWTDVERFADHRQQKHGVHVRKICFEQSEHVKHFIAHPVAYVKYVVRFINDCLASFRGDTKID